MQTSEFDFVDRTALALGKKAEKTGIDSLSEAEQALVACWWAAGLVGNGGFEYLFEGAFFHGAANQMPRIERSFALVHLPEAAAAVRGAAAVFAPGVLDSGPDATNAVLESYTPEALEKLFDPFNVVIWDLSRSGALDTALATHIRAHGLSAPRSTRASA